MAITQGSMLTKGAAGAGTLTTKGGVTLASVAKAQFIKEAGLGLGMGLGMGAMGVAGAALLGFFLWKWYARNY